MKTPFAILFVCTGNICRSPTAEAMFRHRIHEAGLAERFRHDSAGMHGYHIGEAPDKRSIAHLKKRGIDMADLRARKVTRQDFSSFDLILAMDNSHLDGLMAMKPPGATAEVALYLDYAHGSEGAEVADPYYGPAEGFEAVIEQSEAATEALLKRLSPRNSQERQGIALQSKS